MRTKIVGFVFLYTLLAVASLPSAHAGSGTQFFINIGGQWNITLDGETSDSTENVKTKIQDKLGLLPSEQALFFGDRQLQEGQTLADINIQHESWIHLYFAPFRPTYASDLEWNGGTVQVLQFADYHGGGLNVTQTTVEGRLDLSTADASSPLTLSLMTKTFGDTPVTIQNFDLEANASWIILSATEGIIGYQPGQFAIDTTGFFNDPTSAYRFAISQSGNDLILNYTVPEPSSAALLIIAGFGIHLLRRKRA